MGLLNGKKVLVTGGSRGIGAAIVQTAITEGAEVAFLYHQSEASAAELSAKMAALVPGCRCLAAKCDVADVAATRDVVKAVAQELGRIDVLVNNAGIVRDSTLARMERDRWDEVISTNLSGTYNVCKQLILPLVKQRAGCIINMASLSGVYGVAGQANYSAAKAGIIGLTKALSKEVAPFGVRVNAVAPGLIETAMTADLNDEVRAQLKARVGLSRFGTAEEVANVVCFLGSEMASYITGTVIHVDGGLVL